MWCILYYKYLIVMLLQFLFGGQGSLMFWFGFFVCVLFSIHRLSGYLREEEWRRRSLKWWRINRQSGGGLIATPLLNDPRGFNPLSLVCFSLAIRYKKLFFYCQVKNYGANRKSGTRNTSTKKITVMMYLSVTFRVLYLFYLLLCGFSRWNNLWIQLFCAHSFLGLLSTILTCAGDVCSQI